MAILNGKPRTATAVVLEDARMLVIGAKTLEAMISKNPEIAIRLIKKLARRLDAADEMIQMLLNPNPLARVLLALKRHAETFGEETPTGIKVHFNATSLAAEAGARESDVEDVLSRLRRLRIAAEDETGRLLIADVGRLLEFLEFLEAPRMAEDV
jgi:CRP-like cAMP-binding protein